MVIAKSLGIHLADVVRLALYHRAALYGPTLPVSALGVTLRRLAKLESLCLLRANGQRSALLDYVRRMTPAAPAGKGGAQ